MCGSSPSARHPSQEGILQIKTLICVAVWNQPSYTGTFGRSGVQVSKKGADEPLTMAEGPDKAVNGSSAAVIGQEAPATKDDKAAEYPDTFARYSDLPPSSVPLGCFRGTQERIIDCFAPHILAEVSDPETLQALPYLLPPPQPPSDSSAAPPSSSRALWGQSLESRTFLPPSPGDEVISVDPDIAAKLERFLELKRQGMHFNKSLMETHAFKNPHLYSGLVSMLGIDEAASNLPFLDTARSEPGWRSVFPFSEEMLIEGDPIAASNKQSQEAYAAREAKINAKGKRSIDFVSSSTSASDDTRKTAQADKQARLDESAHGRSKQGRLLSSHHSTSDRHRRSRESAEARPKDHSKRH
ncbi:hypothetical protein PANT_9d00212 [Moesziomyces antarcticus T-34]|uniref:HCNGP-domain-containing protein n=1 Tax=Pseudozyma antarctica (strain T-34) TaxID=1151754 RepID=M9MCN1_PSEA3|nr:hypothetical protein PANT_9d00212 [Moesziomyces antarcticus T-34]